MANNIFVRVPKRGDAVVGRLSDKKIFYISAESYVPSELDSSVWETQGVVSHRDGREVSIVGLNRKNLVYCDRPWFYISDYELDGQEHSVVFSTPTSADWNKRVEKPVAYKASTDAEFVKQLNNAFAADGDLDKQDWYADLKDDGRVRIHFSATALQQYSQDIKSGAKLSSAMPEIPLYGIFASKNGGGGPNCIINMPRAVAFYRNDNGAGYAYLGGLTAEVSSVKRGVPINLPTWLGTSTKNPGDFCSYLRGVYGEGEDGWMRFMASCQLEKTIMLSGLSVRNGVDMTKLLSKFTYTSRRITEESPMCKAAAWCSSYSTLCLPAGSWHLPSVRETAHLVSDITYGTSTEMDILNRTITLSGGSVLSNGQSLWSCVRAGASNAWHFGGSFGCASSCSMFNSWLAAAPLTLQTLDI